MQWDGNCVLDILDAEMSKIALGCADMGLEGCSKDSVGFLSYHVKARQKTEGVLQWI